MECRGLRLLPDSCHSLRLSIECEEERKWKEGLEWSEDKADQQQDDKRSEELQTPDHNGVCVHVCVYVVSMHVCMYACSTACRFRVHGLVVVGLQYMILQPPYS